MHSVKDKILARIRGHGRGWVFCWRDFIDLGARQSLDKGLSTLAKDRTIRRIVTGIYDFPVSSSLLGGMLSPVIAKVAQTIARKNGVTIQPSRELAANLLGLSTQVPAHVRYLTNGKSRTVQVGRSTLEFKHAAPQELQPGSTVGVLVSQALRSLGRANVDASVVKRLRRILPDRDKKQLLKDARHLEDWIWEAAKQIAIPAAEERANDG